jgi:hypothetical protein
LQTLLTQSCPAAQSLFDVHCGFASVALQQTPLGPQTGMRASIDAHVNPWVVGQSKRQKPVMHCWFDLQSELPAHTGFGRVSGTHAPWLQ